MTIRHGPPWSNDPQVACYRRCPGCGFTFDLDDLDGDDRCPACAEESEAECAEEES